uniref:ARID domain-containing protein n=1 Tax=Periophthalmus magnuspinnatus TaxID=409849 RepID=A0A3B3ZJV3_9GOBI
MKVMEEPAYLTVGTDVSAKYRGAFCEAKIKTVKRLVKVKVTLKGEGTSQVVHDDQVKGQLRVGSVVEVKTNEGGNSEAVISKLTDASLYTVVFDDGDEKTLRRTSLCLKGERHFAESETLDQLPLTNPEHFGTPVIGKKSNRGRRSSQAVPDEENESSSSEEEEEESRVSDELLGTVCSVEGPEPGLVLVLSPVCNEELVVKKDHCLVRSFGDGKFAAQAFLRTRAVPEVWKMDLSQILESSSDSDDKHSDEDQEEQERRKKRLEEEPEEEPDPEERDHFLQQLYKFMEDRGTPINKPPVLGYKGLNLFKLFRLVTLQGGCSGIESGTVWKQIYMDLGIPVLNSAAAYNVKTAYKKYLFGFEEFCRSALITFRTIHHNNPCPPPSPTNQRAASETKTSPPSNHTALPEPKSNPVPNQRTAGAELKDTVKTETDSESDSDHEERHTSPRGRRRCVLPLKDKRGTDSDEQREPRKRTPRQTDQSERTPRLTDQSESGGRLSDQSERGSDDEEDDDDEEEEDELPRRETGGNGRGEEDPDGVTGTRVRVKYGRGKTQKIYEAHIKKTDVDNGENFYLVHYYGWNVRYTEEMVRSPAKLLNNKSPLRDWNLNARSPQKERCIGDRSPLRATVRSPARDKKEAERNQEDRTQGERTQGERTQGDRTQEDKNQGDRTQEDKNQGERTQEDKNQGERTQEDKNQGERTQEDKNQGERTQEDKNQGERTQEDKNQGERTQEDKNQGERTQEDKDQGERTQEDKNLGERTQEDKNLGERTQENKNLGERTQEDKNLGEGTLRSEKTEDASSPLRPIKTKGEIPDKIQLEKAGTDNIESEKTTVKRKAPEQKSPEKKLKTETQTSPKTTNMADTEQQSGARQEEVKMEVREAKGDDEEPEQREPTLPEMGPEALVCYEVDLDEPDEREKAVSASEQLLLMMRESHLHLSPPVPHKVPPTPSKGLSTLPKAPSTVPEHNCTERREERGNTGGNEQGRQRGNEDTNSSSTSNSSHLRNKKGRETGKKRRTRQVQMRPTDQWGRGELLKRGYLTSICPKQHNVL